MVGEARSFRMAATPTTTNQHPRLAVQAFWLTASKGLAAILNIGLPILLVRLMAQTEYGIFKEAFLFVSTATNVATFGVGMSAFYFMPRHPERGGQIALEYPGLQLRRRLDSAGGYSRLSARFFRNCSAQTPLNRWLVCLDFWCWSP